MRWGQAEGLWKKWAQAEETGRKPPEFLPEISDESLIQLLLTCPRDKARERDVVATEAFNRMLRTRRRLAEITDTVTAATNRLDEAIEHARPAIHATEEIAKREKKGEFKIMDPAEAIEIAHQASECIEDVRRLRDETQATAEKLRQFTKWRMETAREQNPEWAPGGRS